MVMGIRQNKEKFTKWIWLSWLSLDCRNVHMRMVGDWYGCGIIELSKIYISKSTLDISLDSGILGASDNVSCRVNEANSLFKQRNYKAQTSCLHVRD